MNSCNHAEEMFLAREISERLVARLEFMTIEPKRIFNVGLETGYSEQLLAKRFPNAMYEAEIVTLEDHSVDLIFANLFLPWCGELNTIFQEWRRILRPEGLLIFSSLGPDTLIELRESYADLILPNRIDMHNVGDELMRARFADPVMDTEYLTVTYRELKKLTHELKQSHMLVNEAVDLQLDPNSNGQFSITYEIVYGHAWGPDLMVDHVADEAGVVKIPLSHLRRR